ncbi:DUF1707 SHOCT-like domain-containing protein [Pseudonocardia pini]|uniref:DUF1707 SHOCT-like domain-containing protein n=1 Tax=Pseudonocardia pini TaxID=2758030 RepID=UPI001C689431|nr:DUF1707 domain-containing protein [Pseudonocardia pini]
MSEETRIGTAERESAAKALNAHLEAGRLGVEEYADRSATAATAVTAGDLSALFTDLPEPHPVLPGHAPTTAVAPRPAAQAPERRFSGAGARLAAASPIVAVVLFFVLSWAHVPMAWLAFLLIPLIGALGFSREHREEREQRRD